MIKTDGSNLRYSSIGVLLIKKSSILNHHLDKMQFTDDQQDVLRMRGAMPREESVIFFMAKKAMDKTVNHRALPVVDMVKEFFLDAGSNFLDLLYN